MCGYVCKLEGDTMWYWYDIPHPQPQRDYHFPITSPMDPMASWRHQVFMMASMAIMAIDGQPDEDCIFYSNHWTLLREGKGSSSGSDHKPVYVPRLSAVFFLNTTSCCWLIINKPEFFGGSHGSPWGLWVEYGWIFVSLSGSWWQLVVWFVIRREHTFCWQVAASQLFELLQDHLWTISRNWFFFSKSRLLWAFLTGFRRLNWL